MNLKTGSPLAIFCLILASFFLAGCPDGRAQVTQIRAAQSVDLYGEGTTLGTVTVNSGDTFNMDAIYALYDDYTVGEYGPLADEVRFDFSLSVFEPISNQTIATPGTGQSWTVPVQVKGNAASGTYTITPRLYASGTMLADNTDFLPLTVMVNFVPSTVFAVITMTPENIGVNSTAQAELVYSSPATEERTWFSTGAGMIPDPGTDQIVPTNGNGFSFNVSTLGSPVFASMTWAANSNALMARYEMFVHPQGPQFMAQGTWSGNLTGDVGGTATLTLMPERSVIEENSGLHWTSDVSVDVIVDTSNEAQFSWTEQTDYPFADGPGPVNYRITIDGIVGGQLQVTVQERNGLVVTETFTGLLTGS